MIRKKAKTIFLLAGATISLWLLNGFLNVYAAEYNANAFLKISNLPNNKNALITGKLENSLIFDSFSFDANLLLDDDSYIYALENRDKFMQVRGSGGISYHGDNYLLSLGALDSVASKSFYNKLFVLQDYSFGVKALSRLDSEIQSYYTLMGSHLENNTALSMLYLKSFLDETLYFGVSATPSMKYSVNPHRSIVYQEDKSVLDTTLIYYNEYASLGYGLNASARSYLNFNKSNDNANDFAVGLNLDYFGFAFQARSLLGNNNFTLSTGETQSYESFETSLYYSISNIRLGGYYLSSNIATENITYKTGIVELDLQYSFGENFALYSAMFYENLKLDNNTGLLLGFSASF
ncbi:MAG: hypothetical protein LBH40_04835 [Alphaproteobacteria bacterium]|jgi:hypothetical protein|nr:hypothetical protein [Alphaproteobacteria bacterium]